MFLKTQHIFQRAFNYIKWLFMLYEMNTQISICEPWERVFSHILLLLCASIVILGVIYVLSLTRMLLNALTGTLVQDSYGLLVESFI
ncbi:PREDICTED: uncharacterized protein LOC108365416 [Rhagoletis zephyria]|uniref:uncharacterized protein LOC108365416 n=1 Tax=Rhagoletis zephyria TaxID=28612 RepID=UPI00081185E6|nr:PREDICTED: uncharacterized protein LOC108365416 [Rhagoletis zephyria]